MARLYLACTLIIREWAARRRIRALIRQWGGYPRGEISALRDEHD